MTRVSLLMLAVAQIFAGAAGAGEPGGPTEPIELRIENNGQQAIRCVAVLAHFVTRDLAAIAPGESLDITLMREPSTGALAYGSHGGMPMMLENLLCGTTAAWTDSYADALLLPIRSDPARRFHVICDNGVRLRCRLKAAGG